MNDNFIERVHAYSKWLLGLEITNQADDELEQETPTGASRIR
jgi:hypothetical protein